MFPKPKIALSGLLVVVVMVTGVALVWARRSPGPQITRGNALEPQERGVGYGTRGLPPGQEVVFAGNPTLRNISDSTVTITRIEPIEPAVPRGSIEIISFDLSPQGVEPVTPGTYQTFPPVESLYGGGCVTQELEPVRGYILDPSTSDDDATSVFVRLRAIEESDAKLEIARVFYEQHGRPYFQDIHFSIEMTIKKGAYGYPGPGPFEKPCITDDTDILGTR